MSITASAIVAEWGAYYRANQGRIQDLIALLRQQSVTEGYFPVRLTNSTIMEKASASTTRVLQRFQKAFTPVAGVTLEPRKIPMYRLKIDVAEYPDDLVETWAGFLTSNKLDRKEWPFVRWYAELLIKQSKDDLENHEIFKGVPGTITPGTATAQGESMLGIRKIIRDSVTAGDFNSMALGAVPTDPVEFVEYVEAFFYGMPELIRQEVDAIFMNTTLRRRYREGMRLKYNAGWEMVKNRLTIEGEECKVVGLPSHAGSDMIWATPEWNRQRGLKGSENEELFEVESVDRQVKFFTDYHKGVGFWIHEYGYTNGQDLS